jgi:hypothetical protein
MNSKLEETIHVYFRIHDVSVLRITCSHVFLYVGLLCLGPFAIRAPRPLPFAIGWFIERRPRNEM